MLSKQKNAHLDYANMKENFLRGRWRVVRGLSPRWQRSFGCLSIQGKRAHARMHTNTSEGKRGGDANQQRKGRKVCDAT